MSVWDTVLTRKTGRILVYYVSFVIVIQLLWISNSIWFKILFTDARVLDYLNIATAILNWALWGITFLGLILNGLRNWRLIRVTNEEGPSVLWMMILSAPFVIVGTMLAWLIIAITSVWIFTIFR